MAWITTPPYTRSVRDKSPWMPPTADDAGPGTTAAGKNPEEAQPPQPAPEDSTGTPVRKDTSRDVRSATGRVLRTIACTGEGARSDVRRSGISQSLFRGYPKLFHRMASRRRGTGLVSISLYDTLLLAAFLAAMAFLLLTVLSPPPGVQAPPTAPTSVQPANAWRTTVG